MSRNRKYDYQEAVKTSVDIFRRKGYHATGSDELVQLLNIPKGTFYGMFKSKENFAIASLNQYVLNTLSFMNDMLYNSNINSSSRRIENMYKALAKYFIDEGCSYGCLLNNLSLEVAGQSDPFKEAIDAGHSQFIQALRPCIIEAQMAGEFRSDISSQDLASIIHTNFDGALVKMKGSGKAYPMELFLSTIFKLVSASNK